MLVLARLGRGGRPVKVERVAREGGIPPKFLEGILAELRRAGMVESKRGAEGGYWLARPPADLSVADVVRVIDGPPVLVAGREPAELAYPTALGGLAEVWAAAGAAGLAVMEDARLDRLAVRDPAPDFQI
ncbi:MAG: Rrf2 family transcriptional regulator [Thermoleophilia bacterium]|jgi:Rrf2 family protein|nr:Rrf2 family transcriptional regulator [Thermoleophilia bacterium]